MHTCRRTIEHLSFENRRKTEFMNNLLSFFGCILFALVANVLSSAGATTINVGSLFPLSSDHGSGNHELAAVLLAISHVNNKTDDIADNLLVDFQARLSIV